MSRTLAVVFALASVAGAFRHRHKDRSGATASCPVPRAGPQVQPGELAEVDFVYSFGSPGPTSPRLQHQRNADGVIPGIRTWQKCCGGWEDIVPVVTGAVGLWHPLMAGEIIEDSQTPWRFEPSNTSSGWPSTIWASPWLHLQEGYQRVTAQRTDCQEWNNYQLLSTSVSYSNDIGWAAWRSRQLGWPQVAWANYDRPDGGIGGTQHMFLMQNPNSLECVLTFQGTIDADDWWANFQFSADRFCGLVEEDENCDATFGTCSVRKPRGAFAHWGFAEHLRNIVRTDQFQTNIRPKLGKCSSVYATGHSLGGSAAALFAACVSQRLQPGDFGYEQDYQHMFWTKETPALIEGAAVADSPPPYPEAAKRRAAPKEDPPPGYKVVTRSDFEG